MLQQIIESPVKDKDDKYIHIGEDTLFKDVIEVKRSLAGSLYKSNMTMVEITLKGYYDVLNEWVRYTRVVGANGQEATIDYGSFLVLESDYSDDTEETKLVAYDKMILSQTEYRHEDMGLTFPTTIKAVFDRVLQVCGLETTTTSFENMNELVQEEVWHNTQYTYRDVLDHIAQVSGSIVGIKNDKVEVYYPSESDYTIQQKNLTSLKMGDDYGEINILNLTREPQHDNYAYAYWWKNLIPENARQFESPPWSKFQDAEVDVTPAPMAVFDEGYSRNLLVSNTIIDEMYLNISSPGNLLVANNHMASDFIKVDPLTDYTYSAPHVRQFRICYYDIDKVWIEGDIYSGDRPSVNVYQTPSNAEYIRVSAEKTIGTPLDGDWKIEKGNNPNPTWTPAWEDLPLEDKPVSFIETSGGVHSLKYLLNVGGTEQLGTDYLYSIRIKNVGLNSLVFANNGLQVNETLFSGDSKQISKVLSGNGFVIQLHLRARNISDNLSFYAYNPQVNEKQEVDFSEIPPNERKEIVFQNNPIVDKNREYWAPKIFPLIANTHYKTFSANTLSGYGIFDIGDVVEVEEYNTGLTHTALITDEHTTHRHMLVSEVKSAKPFDSKERYVVVTDERREGQQTYILVDQLNGEIVLATEKIGDLEDKATELELDIDGLMARVETIHNGNVIPNINGELGYFGWLGQGSLIFTDDLVFREGLTTSHTFVPKEFDNSLSIWGISFYGRNRSPLGRIVPNTHYSWRGKAMKFLPFDITVIEYAEDKTIIDSTTYNFTNPSTYLQFTHEPTSDTRYIALDFDSPTATYTNRLELSEMMFNRGEPKEWFESAESAKIWAESMFEIQDDMIQSTVSEINEELNTQSSTITQMSDNIELKVDKDGVIGSINVSPEGLKISSGKLEFDNAVGNNVDLSGKITAESGKIGGYTISGDNLVGNDVTLGINQVTIGQATFSSELVSGMPNTLNIDSNYVNIGQSGTSRLFLGKRTFSIVSDTLGMALGTSNNPINYIYLKNQPIVTSDLRRKHAIQDIPKDLIDEIIKVEPKMYLQHKTWHFGYIAQDIERALYKWATNNYGREAKHYVDKFAFLHKDESHLSLLYGEIAVLKEKSMSDRISKLERELQEIKELLRKENVNGL